MIENFHPFGMRTYLSVALGALAAFIAASKAAEFANSYSAVGDAPRVTFPKS